MPAPITIIGGGLASASAARALRREGYDGEVVLLTAEPHHPYERPPLTKDYLRGEADRGAMFKPADSWYVDNDVEVRTGATVVGLDAGAHRLALTDGGTAQYRKLLLATGSTPRTLPVPGADLRGVLTLRTVDSADLLAESMRTALREGAGRLVVIGDGWIGMEVAASARALGMDVTVVGHGAVPLARVLGDAVGAVYAGLHTDNGVRLRPRSRVVGITGADHRVTGAELDGGEVIPADVVLVAVGATPNVGLAAGAGLEVIAPEDGGGVAVDERLATSHPDIYAAGDIAGIPSPIWGRRIRVEHWATALRTGPHAARAMLGADAAYARLPYFYSDQFDTNLEYSGYVGPDSAARFVTSGDVDARAFAGFWVSGDRVQAGVTLNVPDRNADVEALISSQEAVEEQTLRDFAAS